MKKLASIVLSTFVGTVAVFVAFHGNASLLNTAGLLAVVGDVDPWDDLGSNDIFYDAFLGDSQNILFWSRPAPNANLLNYYSNSPGVTTTVGGSAVPDMLDGVDLLVMSLSFDVGLFTFPAEINAIKDFLKDGGSVLVMAESDDASTLATYNRFLSDIGSSISYTEAHSRSVTLRPPRPSTPFDDLPFHFFYTNSSNTLSGGITPYDGGNGPVVAYEIIPEPASLALLAIGGGVLLIRRRQG